jgi:hypothetical protein
VFVLVRGEFSSRASVFVGNFPICAAFTCVVCSLFSAFRVDGWKSNFLEEIFPQFSSYLSCKLF